jgi:uncharacterized membrane protein YesL
MAGGIFNPENGFYRFTEKLVDLVFLSVFWIVCSLPVFTLGPATAALYHTVSHCIRGNGRNSWTLFFRTFRENFKVGAVVTLSMILPAGLLLFLHELLYQTTSVGASGVVLYIAYCVFLLLPVGFFCYLFPVLSRFTFDAKGLILTCGKLAIAHLPSTVLLALVLYLAQMVFLNLPVTIAILPAVVALLHAVFLERIFAPYVQAQQEAEMESDPETGAEDE